jgi:hypothetical protein
MQSCTSLPEGPDGKNTLYSLWQPWRDAGIGIDEATDAYTGSPWLQYYVGALGVALGAGSADLYTRSALVRLPFALLGCAGLAWLFWTLRPAFGPTRVRRLAFAALYALLLASSVLLLHLRGRVTTRRSPARPPAATLLRRVLFASRWPVRRCWRRRSCGCSTAFQPRWSSARARAVATVRGRSPPRQCARARAVARARAARWRSPCSSPCRCSFLRLFAQTRLWNERFGDAGPFRATRPFVLTTLCAAVARAGARAERSRLVAGASGSALDARADGCGVAAPASWACDRRYALLMRHPFLFERYSSCWAR